MQTYLPWWEIIFHGIWTIKSLHQKKVRNVTWKLIACFRMKRIFSEMFKDNLALKKTFQKSQFLFILLFQNLNNQEQSLG